MSVSFMPSTPVTQDELLQLFAFDNEIYRLQKMRDALAASIFARLLAGSICEPGPHHAEIQECCCGDRREERLSVR